MWRFGHAAAIWNDYPELAAAVCAVERVTIDVDVDVAVSRFEAHARTRLDSRRESELEEIRAWRRAFARMGLEPTRYRCAAEALLRRFRKDGSLPRIHPLVDLCNAASLAFAIPVAAFDSAKVEWPLEVRYATGDETYETFSGETEHPVRGEVVFADAAGRAHARRWTNRQSGYSAVRAGTSSALVVAEALHASARADVARLLAEASEELSRVWSVRTGATLSSAAPWFEL
jgi:DNA/RNA-binding domain of Phe-tRNA-synthetase-like protein